MNEPQYDAIIVGAGFSGLRALHEVRELGMSVKVLEAGSDVGGTWYWNRYPGARTDSESWVYCYDFDDELLQDYDHPERFPTQPQSLKYIQHVADRYDMRRDIQFDTRITGAAFDAESDVWTITTEAGEEFTCRWYLAASGLLNIRAKPSFPGVDSFEGRWLETARWPQEDVDFSGKRVAIIGTGATGIQAIPVVAQTAGSLTVFQRTPNYVVPARNFVIDDHRRAHLKANYDQVWDKTYNHVFGLYFTEHGRLFSEMPDKEERRRVWDSGWEAGGFRFLFETFDDILLNQECNDEAAEYVRDKIRAIVDDPETAELLCPDDHPIGGKRVPAGHFYYEAFNHPHVDLVGVRDNPIAEITGKGVKLEDGTEHEFDIIISALGFDAITGSMTALDVRGRDGQTIKDAWGNEAPEQYLALTGAGFPNLFTIAGPQGAFGNFHSFMNKQVDYVGALLKHAQEHGHTRVEVRPDVASEWADQCEQLQKATLLEGGRSARSWFLGANIPGKRNKTMFYFGGVNAYNNLLQESIDSGFPEYDFSEDRVAA